MIGLLYPLSVSVKPFMRDVQHVSDASPWRPTSSSQLWSPHSERGTTGETAFHIENLLVDPNLRYTSNQSWFSDSNSSMSDIILQGC
jgi:hypothetical protein